MDKLYATESFDPRTFTERLVEVMLGMVVVYNIKTGEYIYVSSRVEKILGYTAAEFKEGGIAFVSALVHPEDLPRIIKENEEALAKANIIPNLNPLASFEYRMKHKDGTWRWVETRGSIFNRDKGGMVECVLNVSLDITEQKQYEQKIRYHIYHDSLTDLPNRIMFSEKIQTLLKDAEANKKVLGLLIIDLDRFKMINDSLGHAIGDRIIQEVGLRLAACIGEKDILARLGGDEFTVIMTQIEREEEPAKLSQKIIEAMKPSVRLDGQELYISPSIGISLYPYDGKDVSSIMKNADSALYRAKEQGRNNYQFYTSSMNARAFEQLTLENTLRRALEHKEFLVHYIPQIDAITGEIVETEALIRWRNPELGLIHAEKFIHLAENTGLIEEIDQWVLEEACRQTKQWQSRGIPNLQVAVNLSSRDFQRKDFVDMIIRILKVTELQPQHLGLELTERTLIENADAVIKKFDILSQLGVRFIIDDFNTDFSSLNYIKKFPMVDTIKIGHSFVRGVPRNSKDSAIARSIISLGHSLNMRVVAEGVERKEQLDFLLKEKCDRMQGYYFSAGVLPGIMAQMLGDRRFQMA